MIGENHSFVTVALPNDGQLFSLNLSNIYFFF